MTEETTQVRGEQDDPVALLVRAVNQLPAQDRDQVFAWLLRVGWRHHPSAAVGVPWPGGREDRAAMYRIFQEAKSTGATSTVGAAAGQQTVPVRFPAEQHAKLRDWCTQHGFSMATVIRGLVGKFLEEQIPQHN
jgi:ParG